MEDAVEFEKLLKHVKSIDIQSRVNKVYDTFGQHNPNKITEQSLAGAYKVLGVDGKLPLLVSDSEFLQNNRDMLFSGSEDIVTTVASFQTGESKKNGRGLLGQGQYFTTSSDYACKNYTLDNSLTSVMVAKLSERAKTVTRSELIKLLRMIFPKSEEFVPFIATDESKRKLMAVSHLLNYSGDESLFALILGFDVLKNDGKYTKDGMTVVMNRDAVIQPKNPIASRFVKNIQIGQDNSL